MSSDLSFVGCPKIQNPKSKIRARGGSQEELLHNGPKSKTQNPAKKFGFGRLDWKILGLGFRILDYPL